VFAFALGRDGRLAALDPEFARLSGLGPGDPFPLPETATLTLGGAVWSIAAVPDGDGQLVAGIEAGASFVAAVAAADPRPPGQAGDFLLRLARRLDGVRLRSGSLTELAEEIRLFSLNAILAAHRLRDSAAIGAVAGLMKTRSDAAGPDILALDAELSAALAAHDAAALRVALGRVQAELLPRAPWLAEPLARTLEAVAELFSALEAAVDRVAARSAAVEEHLKTLRFLELQGRIEAARADDTAHVRMLFEEIGQQVRTAGDALKGLAARRDRDAARIAREAFALAGAVRKLTV
jgi:hypothetical protein